MIKQYNKDINSIRAFFNGGELEYSIESTTNCSDGFVIPFCTDDEEVLSSFFDIESSKSFYGVIFTNKRLIRLSTCGERYISLDSVPYSQIVYWKRHYTIYSYEKEVRFDIYGSKLDDGYSEIFCEFEFDITDDYNAFEKLLVEKVSNNSK